MSLGLGPKLPLTFDATDGVLLIKNYRDLVSQNLKNLLLTSPGERPMNPDFGVGIYNMLFEQNLDGLGDEIRANIITQVGKYMPFLRINSIDISKPTFDSLKIVIDYYIAPLNVRSRFLLDTNVSENNTI